MPPGEHFYVYGEGERLMTPVFYIGRRDVFSADEWSAWFAALAARRGRSAARRRGVARRQAQPRPVPLPLYASLKESGTPEMQARMLPGVAAALKALD